MATPYLEYTLHQGYIHNWLVAGPEVTPIKDTKLGETANIRALVEAQYDPTSGIETPPVQLETFTTRGQTLEWQYYRCLDDHFIHLSEGSPTNAEPHYLRQWAYAQIVLPQAIHTDLIMTTNSPVMLWCNGDPIHRHPHSAPTLLKQISFPLSLDAGVNELLIRLEQLADGGLYFLASATHLESVPCLLAMQLPDLDMATTTVRLPCGSAHTERFQALERLFDLATLDRDIFTKDENICVHWPAHFGKNKPGRFLLRLHKPDGRIYAETLGTPKPGGITKTVPGLHLLPGPYQLTLMPQPEDYAEGRVRVRRTFDIHALNTVPGENPKEDYAARLYEGVQHAMRQDDTMLANVAAMTLDAWRYVRADDLLARAEAAFTLDTVPALRDRVATLGVLYRYGDHADFPAQLRTALETTIHEEAEGEPIAEATMALDDEVAQCLRLTVNLLTRQRYTTHDTEKIEAQAEAQAIGWLCQRGQYGLRTGLDDGDALDTLIFALSHLADLANATSVRELAAVLLDKVLFTMAINTFQGVGLGGILGTTASVGRALWGIGAFNTHLWGLVGLANARAYPVPPLVGDIARDTTTVQVLKEHHTSGVIEAQVACMDSHEEQTQSTRWAYDRVTYRTPAFALSSLQTCHPEAVDAWGRRTCHPERSRRISHPNSSVRAWQATLSPEAIVYTNAPSHYGPTNFWRGDAAAPRVVQWRDVLIAIYNLPNEAWLDFTHAYFPTYAFDEHALRKQPDGIVWAFARKDNAYLALTAYSPLRLIHEGPEAHRELRASGRQMVWLCQMGRAEEDGDFAAFQAKVLVSSVAFTPLAVRWTTVRGISLTFGWDTPLLVNGEAVAITTSQHYETPYCTAPSPAEVIDVRYGGYMLRLDFRKP